MSDQYSFSLYIHIDCYRTTVSLKTRALRSGGCVDGADVYMNFVSSPLKPVSFMRLVQDLMRVCARSMSGVILV